MACLSDPLARLVARYSYRTANGGSKFLLASGRYSDLLIDLSQTLRRPDGRHWLLVTLDQTAVGRLECDAVGGPSLGADPLASTIAARRNLPWFSVRKERKGRGLDTGLVTGPVMAGDKVLLVEDVVTTGGSALAAATACRDAGLQIVEFLACVDREEGGLPRIKEALKGVPCNALVTLSQIERVRRDGC